MANETVARRYAQAIFSLAGDAQRIEPVGHDLRSVADALTRDENVTRYFVSPIVDRAEKSQMLATTLEAKVDKIVLHSLLLLVRKRRERLLGEISNQYDMLERKNRGAQPLVVTSARTIAASELSAMVARLSTAYGKTFEVEQRVDPSLLGGVRVAFGDTMIDDTISGRLEELSRSLFSPQ